MTRRIGALLACCLMAGPAVSEEASIDKAERLRWFRQARLGIFLHWGIYAVDGVSESWSFHNGDVSHAEYMRQLDGFTASRYEPRRWAELIRGAGARYAVLTAKHHDGVALWDSEATELNVVNRTPAGRDLIEPYVKALRGAGLKVGLYYSLIDWSDPDYPNFTRTEKRYTDDPVRWESFNRSNHAQIEELSNRFRPDLFWFDGDWEQPADRWKAAEIRALLLKDNPGVVVNSRLREYGDYATPEQGVPVTPPRDEYWELCLTMNDSWGHVPDDLNYKSTNQIIRILVDTISMGGNLLLDIGPRADGSIVPEQRRILKELGRWTHKHAEAVYGTLPGLPPGHYYGPTALSADRSILYLYVTHRPIGPLMLKGINNSVEKIRVVGTDASLEWDIKMKLSWRDTPGILYIDLPEARLDREVTVVAVHLNGPVSLYREDGDRPEGGG